MEEMEERLRSSKKVKEDLASMAEEGQRSGKSLSYRDMLAGWPLGIIRGAFENAFQIEHYVEDDSDDDVGPEEDDSEPRVLFTRAEKLERWGPHGEIRS